MDNGSVVTSTWHRNSTEEMSRNVDFSEVCPTFLALHLVWGLQVIEDGQKDRCHRLLNVTFPCCFRISNGTQDRRQIGTKLLSQDSHQDREGDTLGPTKGQPDRLFCSPSVLL